MRVVRQRNCCVQKRTPATDAPSRNPARSNNSRHRGELACPSLPPRHMDTLRQDLAYALRRLRQAPGFTAVAVATLALGIGANGAIFSVVNAVLLRPLPFEEPDRLVRLSMAWKGKPTGVYSPQNFLDLEGEARSFESLAVFDGHGMTLTGRGQPARLEGAEVSATFFDSLRVRPAL